MTSYKSRYRFATTVKQDKAGFGIADVMKELKDIVGNTPITDAEFERSPLTGMGKMAEIFPDYHAIQTG